MAMAAENTGGKMAHFAQSTTPGSELATQPALPDELRDVVLFMSSNGAGVGHLMRLMAMARRLSSFFRPVFFTLSQSVSVVRDQGFPVEYFMSPEYAGVAARTYNQLLSRRMEGLLARYRPRAVVFDGTMPYWGLINARANHPGCAFVWSRRAMWRAGMGAANLRRSLHFDLVIEPGDFAAPADRGVTVAEQPMTRRVDPVRFLNDSEVLERNQARQHLGLDLNRIAVLIQLGAGNINDTRSLVGAAVDELLAAEDIQICVSESVIANTYTGLPAQVIGIQTYPLARYFRAFDFAIMAAGYNSFQEAIAYSLPTIFVPNIGTKLDDQLSRANWAQEAGTGLSLADQTQSGLKTALAVMSDPYSRNTIAQRCRSVARPNGAGPAVRAVEHLLAEPMFAAAQSTS